MQPHATQTIPESVGQCADCRHVREVASDRGSAFFLCRRAAEDPTYARYPRLPVSGCSGHESGPPGDEDGR
jgi:hypothetical protein